MEKGKIHPFTLIALLMSSISMGLYALRNYTNQEMGYGILFTFLCLFFIGLVVTGIIRNGKIKKRDNVGKEWRENRD